VGDAKDITIKDRVIVNKESGEYKKLSNPTRRTIQLIESQLINRTNSLNNLT